ncbi:tripartite tricarboxylate transporter TctB family protein [Sporosarcina sp. CAU 1771]
MSIKTMDRKIGLVIMGIAVFYLVLSFQLPEFPYTQVDADVIPKGLGFLLLGLGALLFLQNKPETEEEKKKRYINKTDLMLLLATLVALLVYVFFLEILGFIISTIIFLSLTMRMYEYRNWIKNIIVSFVFTFFLYFAFNYALKIYLPQGILPF